MTRLFSRDTQTGITKLWHYDATADKAVIETVQDAEPLVYANEMERRAHRENGGKWNDGMHKVASIPMTLYHEFKKAGLFDEKKHLLIPTIRRDYPHLLTVDKV